MPGRLQRREPASAASVRGPAGLRRVLQRLVPQERPRPGRRPAGQRQLLLRQRRHQRLLPDRLVRLLPAPGHHPPPRQPPHLRLLPHRHHGRVRRRRHEQIPAPQPRLRRLRHHGQRDVRPLLRQRDHPLRRLRVRRRGQEIVGRGEGSRVRGSLVRGRVGRSGAFGRGFVM